MVDGLSSELGEVGSPSILDAGVANVDLTDSAASGTKVDVAFAPVADNSGGKGNSIQFGEWDTNVARDPTITFGTAFGAAPNVVVANSSGVGAMTCSVGTVSTVGFTLLASAVSLSGTWIAAGSGRV